MDEDGLEDGFHYLPLDATSNKLFSFSTVFRIFRFIRSNRFVMHARRFSENK